MCIRDRARAQEAGTHLTFTPDRREILVDIQTCFGSILGTFSVKDGSFSQWYHTKPGTPYNHAQMLSLIHIWAP